jgi:hypothetical protein
MEEEKKKEETKGEREQKDKKPKFCLSSLALVPKQ